MRNWRHILNLGAMLTVAAFVRIWNSWSPSLSLDEFATYWVVASKSYSELWERCTHYLAHSPFYFISVRVSYECLGKSEFALRLPTVLAGVFSTYLAFVLGCKYGSALSGTLAGWIMTLHPWFILFSQQARPYAFSVALALLTALSLRNVLSRQGTKQALGFSLSSALLIYTHFLFGLFVLFQSAYWLIFTIFNGDIRRHGRLWVLSQCLILLLLLPAAPQAYTLWSRRQALQYEIDLSQGFFLGVLAPDLTNTYCALLSLVLLGFLSSLLLRRSSTISFRNRASICKSATLYFFIWYMVPWLFYGLLCWLAKTSSFLNLRYLIVYLIAGNFLYIWIMESFHSERMKIAWTILFVVSSFSCNLLPLYLKSGIFSAQSKEDWRGLIQHVACASSSEAPLVLVRSGLIEGDRVFQPALMTATWNTLISSPMSDFYINKPWHIVNLPYHWIAGMTENYLDGELQQKAACRNEFWLVVRGDKETAVFIKNFQRYMSARTDKDFVQDTASESFGISLLHFRKPTLGSL